MTCPSTPNGSICDVISSETGYIYCFHSESIIFQAQNDPTIANTPRMERMVKETIKYCKEEGCKYPELIIKALIIIGSKELSEYFKRKLQEN